MALRIEAALVACLTITPLAAQEPLHYEAVQRLFGRDEAGALTIDERGVAFAQQKAKKPRAWRWNWIDIQQLTIEPGALHLLTYDDQKLKLGADRGFHFRVTGGSLDTAYAWLKDKLDQRFVAALADADVKADWEIPAKLVRGWRGDVGVLRVSRERIVFAAARPAASRTWRLDDLDSVSSSGPYALTLATHERSLADYGSGKGFTFQLRERLAPERYEELWRRLNRRHQLSVLNIYTREN